MELSPFTFEVLIHNLILSKEIIILLPKVSLTLGNLSRLLIEAHNSIGF
jgi:hypothetical protein